MFTIEQEWKRGRSAPRGSCQALWLYLCLGWRERLERTWTYSLSLRKGRHEVNNPGTAESASSRTAKDKNGVPARVPWSSGGRSGAAGDRNPGVPADQHVNQVTHPVSVFL